MIDAATLTRTLGGTWRGHHGSAPCPVCQPERRRDQCGLSLREDGGRLLAYCHKRGCAFREIISAAGLVPGAVAVDPEAQREADAKRAAYEVAQLTKAQRLWQQAKPISGSKAETYLRGRGITCPLPETLRFLPETFHAPSGRWLSAMVVNVEPTGGVHRTFFEKSGGRIARNTKMMLGPCAGGAVRLSDDEGPLVVCEGIETGLSLLSGLLRGPVTVWATLSTSGMKALDLPPTPGKLTIATDGDDPGREAGNRLAMRATALGWKVSLLPAPNGLDWNDILVGRVVSI